MKKEMLPVRAFSYARSSQPLASIRATQRFPWASGLIGVGIGTCLVLSWDNPAQMAAAPSISDKIAEKIEVCEILSVSGVKCRRIDLRYVIFQQACLDYLKATTVSKLDGSDPETVAISVENNRYLSNNHNNQFHFECILSCRKTLGKTKIEVETNFQTRYTAIPDR